MDPADFFKWIAIHLSSSNSNVVDICVQYLQALTSIQKYRFPMVQTEGLLHSILSILSKDTSAQVQYQCIYILWVLSFDIRIAQDLERVHHIVPVLKEVTKGAIKEKIIRIIIATFKNMIVNAPAENIIPMLGYKLLPAIEALSVRKWADSEILDDLMFLREELGRHVQSLSTFDEYSSEVLSRRLEWTPPHQSDMFWKQNASRLNENQNELVKILVHLVMESQDVLVLQIAAHDLGQYVKYAQNGRKYCLLIRIVNDLGGKTAVMGLMAHSDADVRYQALSAVQYLYLM
jgi:V-type H+-transporting ATPase subunit H